ncbi:hypothetical protein, partial [uncultured Oscillibacter sp.]|uniref:hypothetical protein n=1 Tax=uncultured Oscillibacter sp. TaxID=876091 RepID=UPI002618E554
HTPRPLSLILSHLLSFGGIKSAFPKVTSVPLMLSGAYTSSALFALPAVYIAIQRREIRAF